MSFEASLNFARFFLEGDVRELLEKTSVHVSQRGVA